MFLHILKNYNPASVDYVFNTMIVFGNTSFLVPHMALNNLFPKIF
jgi:hypothetical protein